MLNYIIMILPMVVRVIQVIEENSGDLEGSEKRLLAIQRIIEGLGDIPIVNELADTVKDKLISYLDSIFDGLVAIVKGKAPQGEIHIDWNNQEVDGE